MERHPAERLLTASRLGLVFDGATSSAVILRLTEDESSQSQQVYNTVINGQTLGSNQVLQYQNGTVSAATDPSQPIADYTVSFTSDSTAFRPDLLLIHESEPDLHAGYLFLPGGL